MDTNKVLEFFDASKIAEDLHIIGCGAIGSHVAEQLARMGCERIHLWDFDGVAPHNISNQMFFEGDIGDLKTDSVLSMLGSINHKLQHTVETHDQGWRGEVLNGYVFLCVDNIDLRRAIVKANQYNPNCVAFFDFRMRLTDAQHYMAVREDDVQMKALLQSMDFTHEEAKDATPKSACNMELSIIYTVKTIVAVGMANFVKLTQGKPTKHMILVDLNMMTLDAFPME